MSNSRTEEMHMPEQVEGNDQAAIEALSTMLDESMKQMDVANEAQEIAILGTAAVMACLADTAKIPTDRLAAIIGLATQGQAEHYRKKVTDFVSLTVTISKQLPAALAARGLAARMAAAGTTSAGRN
jgi:hypothetical protein